MKQNPSTPSLPEIKTVLVTTDFSPLAKRAVGYACSILPRGGELHLINVQHPLAQPGGTYQQGSWDHESRASHARLLSETLAKLIKLAPLAARNRRLKVHAEILESESPASAITEAARRLSADVICISSHGNTGLRAMMLGSVTQGVLAAADRPVLVVRQRAK